MQLKVLTRFSGCESSVAHQSRSCDTIKTPGGSLCQTNLWHRAASNTTRIYWCDDIIQQLIVKKRRGGERGRVLWHRHQVLESLMTPLWRGNWTRSQYEQGLLIKVLWNSILFNILKIYTQYNKYELFHHHLPKKLNMGLMPGSSHIRRVLKLEIIIELCLLFFSCKITRAQRG